MKGLPRYDVAPNSKHDSILGQQFNITANPAAKEKKKEANS